MQIVFNHSHLNDTGGTEKTLVLGDFILNLPDIGLIIRKTKVIPPLDALNELLEKGICDAGMSGCYEWKPFKIDENEYASFRKFLENNLGSGSKFLQEEDLSLKKWMSLARSSFKKS